MVFDKDFVQIFIFSLEIWHLSYLVFPFHFFLSTYFLLCSINANMCKFPGVAIKNSLLFYALHFNLVKGGMESPDFSHNF
jgi:hypothetical protein